MKISVIITAYNVEPYIATAIDSCLTQTHKDVEIIVVEDCSTDKTKDVIGNYAKNKRVKIIYNEVNVGAGKARRIGSEAATGMYLLFLDGDDWLSSEYIKELHDAAVATKADIVSGGITEHHMNGITKITKYADCELTGTDKLLRYWGGNTFFMCTKIVNRRLFDLVPYCERRYIEDTPTIIPQTYYANKVVYVSNDGYHYRMRSDSLTHDTTPLKNALYTALTGLELSDFFKERNPKIAEMVTYSTNLELKKLKQVGVTKEMIEPFKEDFVNLGIKLLNVLNL